MDTEYLKKQNSILQQRILFLQSQITQLKSSQSNLNSKVKQIDTSRLIVVQKLNDLGKQYQDKIRQLENKIQKLSKQNEVLVKQGYQYKEEIQLFENRILEKERLLTSFVTQGGFASIQTQETYQKFEPQLYRQENDAQEIKSERQILKDHKDHEQNEYEREKIGLLNILEQEQKTQPPPPPPTLRSIEESPQKHSPQKQETPKRPLPPPNRNKIPSVSKTQQKKTIPEVTETIIPPTSPQRFIEAAPEQIEYNDFPIQNIGSSKNIQQSQNFFNQLASNSFVSQIVPRDDNPQIQDTPFSHNFMSNNFQQSQFSQGQNFFDNLAQSQQIPDPQPNEYNPFGNQNQLFPNTPDNFDQRNTNPGNEVNQMVAPPKFVPPKKAKRDRLQVMNSSSFQSQ